jgi:hypothetical protein
MAFGKPCRGGVLGAVAPVQSDYGATAIDSQTGQGSANGDVPASAPLAAFGRTMLAAVGEPADATAADIPSGQVIPGRAGVIPAPPRRGGCPFDRRCLLQ